MRILAAAVLVLGVALHVDLNAQASATSRTFLLFMDDLHLDFGLTPRIRETAVHLVRAVHHDGDAWSVVSTDGSSVSEPPTTDPAVALAALSRVIGGGLKPRELLAMQSRPEGVRELRRRASVALSTAATAIDWMVAKKMTPVSILYFSNGYDNQVADERRALVQKAVGAHVVIHTIDPRGFVVSVPEYVSSLAEWDLAVARTRPSLAALAGETGGRAAFTVRDLETAIGQLATPGRQTLH